ncbi:50S ribosomal protein L25/general stress protein Ctc [Allokutzneria sp. A3M-2-11 16]|uniref:50S ribosomal protein L25/general stress protein Ctc n=1 Tax=Allokutzneria sp. A3M-2-11 16 TaxID=2962043 RepID=UPI0020B8749B|nr:50S ribosomal protein L25/general stress protein Ctc [Allokutzneria sp. A3M-2-11 16]MCP3798752.1 50S ribosomal protein L25/general stress protein Ctc [Allokutzneria sp. A3M-2-11 16]
MSEVRLAAEPRTEFGKGAARRTRRAGKIPAVLYGHGSDPKHVALPALEFARVMRNHGTNTVLALELGSDTELALTKTVVTHPLRNYIEHVDLLLVRRGELVTVDVSVAVTGTAASGTMITQEATEIQVEADALNIPDGFEVSVEGAAVGTQILASSVQLPAGVTLVTDPEALLVNVVAAPSAAQMEAAVDAEGAGVVEDAPETES